MVKQDTHCRSLDAHSHCAGVPSAGRKTWAEASSLITVHGAACSVALCCATPSPMLVWLASEDNPLH